MLQTACMSPELLVNQNMSESETCGYSPGQGSPLPGETASPKSCFQQSPSLPDSGLTLTELNVASPTLYHPPPACTPQGMPAPADSELSPDPPGKRYMGVRVKMPVRELLKKIRLSKGLDPAHSKEASPVKMVTKGSSGKTAEKRRAHPYTEKQLRQSKQSAGQSPKGLEDLDILVEVLQEDLNRSQLREEPLPAAPRGFWQGFPRDPRSSRGDTAGSQEGPRGGQPRSAEPCLRHFHPILRGQAEPSSRAGSQGCGSPGMLCRTGGWWVPSSRKDFRRNCPSQGSPARLSPAEPLPAAPGGSGHTEGQPEPVPVPFHGSAHTEGQPERVPVPFHGSAHTEGQPERVPVPFPSSAHTEGQPERVPVPFHGSGHTEGHPERVPVPFPSSAHTEGHPEPVPVPFHGSAHTEGQPERVPVPFHGSAHTEGQPDRVPVPFHGSGHTEGQPERVPVPFHGSAHTEGQPERVPVPFHGSAHTEGQPERVPVPFPSSAHTEGQPERVPVPFYGSAHTEGQPERVPVPFHGSAHTEGHPEPVPVPVPFPQHDLSALSFFQFQLRREESVLRNIPAEKLLAPDGNGNRLLHKAVAQGRRALTFALAQRFASLNKIDEKDAEKRTALHLAAEKNQHLMVSDLISLGANVNEQDSSGKTPLHLCAENGYLRVLEVLKNCKNNGVHVEVDLPDHYGLTPLHCAALAHTVLVTESQRTAPDSDLGRFLRLRKEQILEGIVCLLQMGGKPELQVLNSCQTSSTWLRLEENTELMCLLQTLKAPGQDVLQESYSLLDTPRAIPGPPAPENLPELCPMAAPDLFDVLLEGKC